MTYIIYNTLYIYIYIYYILYISCIPKFTVSAKKNLLLLAL